MSDNEKYSIHYSDESFWQKVKKYAKKAGTEVIEKALWLYYAAQNPATPVWAKATIYGALGYFILPFDLIPDFLPGGYVDDLGVMVGAIYTVSKYIDAEVKERTSQKLKDWFG